jgi:hypothetical protein
METGWQIVAFPVILPWREEFWSIPLYFPELKVGVVPGWPARLPYRGMPLPPEAETSREMQHYRPGDLRQWHAFSDYLQGQEENGVDLIQAIRTYGLAHGLEPQESPFDGWDLAWQMEKMQADQETQLLRVDHGEKWLAEILAPEPWEKRLSFQAVPGVGEMVDPEVGRMRYLLWLRVMAPYLERSWAPLLLGRTARAIFLGLRGWPEWTDLRRVDLALPGCRSEEEWLQVKAASGLADRLEKVGELLQALLTASATSQNLAGATLELQKFVESELIPLWPYPPAWNWELEIWQPGQGATGEWGPLLCWAGAGKGILPG